MFQCPVCGGRISARGEGQWFQCQYCGNWLCQRIGTNNRTWLDVGIQANGSFTVVVLNTQQGRTPTTARPAPPQVNTPPGQLSLQEIQTERQNVARQVQTVTSNIRRLAEQMAQSRQDVGSITRLSAEITGYNQLQTTLTERDTVLAARETALLEEQRQARRTSASGPSGMVFGCSSGLVAGALIAFTLFVNFTWDINAVLAALVISLIGGTILSIFAS